MFDKIQLLISSPKNVQHFIVYYQNLKVGTIGKFDFIYMINDRILLASSSV